MNKIIIAFGLIGGMMFPFSSCTSADEKDSKVQRDSFDKARNHMVTVQVANRDVSDPEVLRAMRTVPRHLFVLKEHRRQAYEDHPLPIGENQTISQPYIVAKLAELAHVGKGMKVLEIGTGSGYQAAVLAELGADVYTIEILAPLGARAKENLKAAGYSVHTRVGDGYKGWPEFAPFDAVIVTAAPEVIPQPLIDQLAVGARLVLPLGAQGTSQELVVVEKTQEGIVKRSVFPVEFVPMTGVAQEKGLNKVPTHKPPK